MALHSICVPPLPQLWLFTLSSLHLCATLACRSYGKDPLVGKTTKQVGRNLFYADSMPSESYKLIKVG